MTAGAMHEIGTRHHRSIGHDMGGVVATFRGERMHGVPFPSCQFQPCRHVDINTAATLMRRLRTVPKQAKDLHEIVSRRHPPDSPSGTCHRVRRRVLARDELGATRARDTPARQYFGAVCDLLDEFPRAVVAGGHTILADFQHYLVKHRSRTVDRIAAYEVVDHPTDNQLVALARKRLEALDRLA
jgi:hypothetical protein